CRLVLDVREPVEQGAQRLEVEDRSPPPLLAPRLPVDRRLPARLELAETRRAQVAPHAARQLEHRVELLRGRERTARLVTARAVAVDLPLVQAAAGRIRREETVPRGAAADGKDRLAPARQRFEPCAPARPRLLHVAAGHRLERLAGGAHAGVVALLDRLLEEGEDRLRRLPVARVREA